MFALSSPDPSKGALVVGVDDLRGIVNCCGAETVVDVLGSAADEIADEIWDSMVNDVGLTVQVNG